MVRAAVKTLALNVFAIPLPSLRNFLSSPPADVFFDHLAKYTAERCTALDRLLSSWDATAPRMAATVETYLAEIEDILTFCNDVFAVDVPAINSLLLGHLWRQVVGPVLFWPLLEGISTVTSGIGGLGGGVGVERITAKLAAVVTVTATTAGDEGIVPQKSLVGPLCSLYALERTVYAVTDPLLSSLLVSALLGGPVEDDAAALAASLQNIIVSSNGGRGGASTFTSTTTDTSNNVSIDPPPSPLQQQQQQQQFSTTMMTASDLLQGLGAHSSTYRTAVLSMLRGGDAQLAAAVVRLLAAVLSRKTLSEETIEAVGLLPRRRKKQRQLLAELTRDASSGGIFATQETQQSSQLNNGTVSNHAPATETSKSKKLGSKIQLTASTTVQGEKYLNEIIESLLIALNLDLLPPLSLPVIGWVLHRLLSSDSGAAELSTEQKSLLEVAWKRKKEALGAVHAGSWGDAVVPMVLQLWSKVRDTVLRIGPGPVHVAGHTWVQAVLLHELHWQLGGGGGGDSSGGGGTSVAEEVAASNFAVAAKVATIRVAACVALAQVHAVLTTGQVPLHIFKITTSTPPPVDNVLADITAREIREGSVVPLPSNESDCIQCKVAFSRGVERLVALCVLGIGVDFKEENIDAAESSTTTVIAASPVVAIVDPGTGSSLGYGTVLSVAPLLAAAPAVDTEHPQWLHVHVRPQRSVLLQLLKSGPSGAELAAMDQQLAEGHWVLAFPDGDSAKKAAEIVVESANVLRKVHQKAIEQLLAL